MSELNCNRREFLTLTGLTLTVPAISKISVAEAPAPARCLAYDDQAQPLPAAGFERFHLCDQLMRPFTTPIDAAAGEVRFTPPSDGFIGGDGTPREGYHRLMNLLASWRK